MSSSATTSIGKHKRFIPRQRRRLRVEMGTLTPIFTADVSAGGFSADMMRPPKLGSQLHGKIQVGSQTYLFTGQAIWTKAGSQLSDQGRVGVRFTGIENAFFEQLHELYSPNAGAQAAS
jgi:hypothetical protein